MLESGCYLQYAASMTRPGLPPKRSIQAPFFEVGAKNYLRGDAVVELAVAADQAAKDFDIDVLMITPYFDIREVRRQTSRLIILAPHMDATLPGSALADVIPEAVKAAGADGVVLNHAERPLSLGVLAETIARADDVGLLSFVCSDSIAEARAVAELGPDIMNPEPTELLGKAAVDNNWDFMTASIDAVKGVDDRILVEQAAGIRTAEQVYKYILAGAEGVGVASGIIKASNPAETMRAMIAAVRRAADDRRDDRTTGV